MQKLMTWFFRLLPDRKKDAPPGQATGSIPSLKDHRDFAAIGLWPTDKSILPAKHSLRTDDFPLVEDQGGYESCVGVAGCTVLEVFAKNNGFTNTLELSKMDAWNKTRRKTGTYPENQGCSIRDFWKVAQSFDPLDGITLEQIMPYQEAFFNKPTPFAGTIFRHWYPDFRYVWIGPGLEERTEGIKAALYIYRTPVLFCMPVKNSFWHPKNLSVPYTPISGEKTIGYHAMCITGYDDERGSFEVLNSWGPGYADRGYIQIEQKYLVRNAVDLSYPVLRGGTS